MAGLSSATKSIGKGVLAGAVSLVAQPVAGAQQNGVKGFFHGLATGVASAVALPVTGVCIGAYQVARGVGTSTIVTSGSGTALVIRTGMNTEIGQIQTSVMSVEDKKTPLREKLDNFGDDLSALIAFIW